MFISSNHYNEVHNNNEQNNNVEIFLARFLPVTNEVDPRAGKANQLRAMY